MADDTDVPRVVSASREIAASAERIFELIADPSQQPLWDGNDNLAKAEPGQRIRSVGDVFTMTLTSGSIRENHVVEFDEARRIAWTPSGIRPATAGASVALGARAAGRQPHPGHPHLRLVAIDRSESPPARPRYDEREASGISGPACRDRRAPLNCTDRWQSQAGYVPGWHTECRNSGRQPVEWCANDVDKATGRVVAVIVLLIAIAASLRGYLPGVERADAATTTGQWFVAGLCCGPAQRVAGDRGRGAHCPTARSAPRRRPAPVGLPDKVFRRPRPTGMASAADRGRGAGGVAAAGVVAFAVHRAAWRRSGRSPHRSPACPRRRTTCRDHPGRRTRAQIVTCCAT